MNLKEPVLNNFKGALLCLFWFLATYARLCCILSFRVHVKLFYRIVSYRNISGQVADLQIKLLIVNDTGSTRHHTTVTVSVACTIGCTCCPMITTVN